MAKKIYIVGLLLGFQLVVQKKAEAQTTSEGSSQDSLLVFSNSKSDSSSQKKVDPIGSEYKEIEEVVITATRTEKEVSDLPIPVKIITGEQIKQMGSLRLNEVLMEQTGLAIVNDHGTGIQLQGFNPDYTMILVDGEPLIGRTAGTLDLTRIAVGNIKRIEIVKGPSSSLYGSEALAGVINIITEKPKENLSGNIRARYGTNNTLDVSGDLNFRYKKFGAYIFADRYSTSGYKLLASADDQTVPAYQNYTFQTKLTYRFSAKTDLSLSGRVFTEPTSYTTTIEEEGGKVKLKTDARQTDWNINPVLTHRLTEKDKLIARFYSSRYHTKARMAYQSTDSTYDDSYFTQNFTRPEIQYDRLWNSNQQTTVGVGTTFESVEASRYTEKKRFRNEYVYLQHDMTLWTRLNIIAGARFDNHSVYGSQLSPKLSAKYKIADFFSVRGSVGRGFKAPDFRQLYLNFSNPSVGYTVLGYEEVPSQMALLVQQGQVDPSQFLMDPYNMKPLKAERSTSYNLGFIATAFRNKFTLQANFFRNDISDMINTAPIAIKTNGQAVYSYFNQESVYTKGVETDLSYKIHKNITLSGGYQYMIAKDKESEEKFKNGQVFISNANGDEIKLTEKDYFGLVNRSRHMANFKIFYMNAKGWGLNFRAVYRGKYVFGDTNGNGVMDSYDSFVDAYWLYNVAVSKKVFNTATVQLGIDNLANYTNPTQIATIAGRLYYVTLNFELNKNSLKAFKN